MDAFVIQGGEKLSGEIAVSGSKNAALPILAATLLIDGRATLQDIPRLRDIDTMLDILAFLGITGERGTDGTLTLQSTGNGEYTAPYDLVRRMRASISVLGPLLARRGVARVSLPGGCVIGPRPIDLHLKGLRALGAEIEINHGYVEARAEHLTGARVYLGGPFGSSVLATANVLSAAVLADGETIIEHAACEPEVVDLACFLRACGADISGEGTSTIRIVGVESLAGCEYRVIPDRIEAGTYVLGAALAGSEVIVRNVTVKHHAALRDLLESAGVAAEWKDGTCRVRGGRLSGPLEMTTLPYPGFPTDLQAQLMALLATGSGTSIITEKIYPERFMHVSELNRMGASVTLEGAQAVVQGVDRLSGTDVMASDLRASAALVLAALVADGESVIHRVYHVDRGYESIVEKLSGVGARIERVEQDDV